MSTDRTHEIVLNDKQLAVLRWIDAGCPPGVMEGYAHRVSAAALRSRELVRVHGRGSAWRAELTDRGRAYLSNLREQRARSSAPRRSHQRPLTTDSTDTQHPAADSKPLSKTEQLVADVIAAGGKLTLPDDTGNGGVNYRQRAYSAQRHGKVPDGKHLTVSWQRDEFVITLLDGLTGNEDPDDREAIHVPARLTKYHPVAREFRDRTSLQEISRKALPRALRIIHALAAEIESRGHRIACASVATDYRGDSDWKPATDGQFVVTINGHDLKLRIHEKGVGLRGPWEARKKQRQEDRDAFRFNRWDVGRIEAYDKGATGRLEMEVLGFTSRQAKWGDRQRWSLDDRLPQLLRELETQAVEAEERRLARERQAEEEKRQWENAMANAKRRVVEDHRRDLLTRRVKSWEEADAIRAYCDAVTTRHGQDAADPEVVEWLTFARAHADHLQRLPTMPPSPPITHEALKPYMGGWSTYGPHRGRW